MKTKEKTNYLFDNRMLAKLIFPLIIEQLLAVLVGMADSLMIANVGEAAVSGVSLVDNIMLLFISMFAALAAGGSVVAGQYLGDKKEKEAGHAATQLIWVIVLLSLIITAILYLGKNLILDYVFGSIEADVKGHANTYLLIVTASVPFIAVYNGGAAIFRAMGNSRVPMVVSLIMNAINVIGNATLIYGFHRGAEGVAIPTLVSRAVAAVLVIVLLLYHNRGPIQLERTRKIRFDKPMVRRILGIGIPNGMENAMFQLGKILVLSLVATFGTSAIAANAVSNVVAWFEILPGMAINLAITTVIAQCVGAEDYKQARYYTKKLLAIIYLCLIVTNAIIVLLLPEILRAYNLSAETAESARQILYFHTVSCITIWPVAFSLPSTLRAAGDAKVTMWISIVSMWVCRIGCSFLFGKYFGMGVFGVWVAMVMDWCVRSVLLEIRYLRGKWETMRAI